MYSHHPLFFFHLNALPFSVRSLTLIKSRWDEWTWWVAAERGRLIMWGGKGSSCPYTSPFPTLLSLFTSAHLLYLTWLLFHTSWAFFPPSALQGWEEVCFLIRAFLDSRWIGATLGLAHRRLSYDFMIVMISEPVLSSSHSDCEILSQWRDNGFSWSSGFR